jgi:NTP pyrophosphatase (non-canonical NTP hydrolase)
MSNRIPQSDRDTNIQELKDKVIRFSEERGWTEFHSQKNVAIGICLEAAELLEHFQWNEHQRDDNVQAIADELADVLFNVLLFAHASDIDLSTAFRNKLKRTEQKYPVESFHEDASRVDTYHKIKKAYRAKESGKP